MVEPPNASESEGPVCKNCGKPMNRHTYSQQLRCEKEAKENGI